MRADYRQQAVAFQKLTHAFVCIEERATPGVVMHEVLWAPLLPKTLDGVRPQYVAHESRSWRLTEPVQLRKQHATKMGKDKGRGARGLTLRMSSIVCNSGDSPPCTHKNCLFMIAARGRAQKDSMHASYTRSEYLCLHSSLN